MRGKHTLGERVDEVPGKGPGVPADIKLKLAKAIDIESAGVQLSQVVLGAKIVNPEDPADPADPGSSAAARNRSTTRAKGQDDVNSQANSFKLNGFA